MTELLAVYGTLRRGGRLHARLGSARGQTVYVGSAVILGHLYEVSADRRDDTVDVSYPCYYPGPSGHVVVDLYDVRDPTLWIELDELEGFHPDDLDQSEYHRRRVALLDVTPDDLEADQAWTYVYVGGLPDPARHIASGDWLIG